MAGESRQFFQPRRCKVPMARAEGICIRDSAHDDLVETACANGLIVRARRTRGGHAGDRFLAAPPMITTEDQAGEFMDKLEATLDTFEAAHGLG